LRKRGLNKTTRELLHTSNGKLLAKDVLEACMLRTYALSQLYDPLARDDNERVRVDPKTGAEEPAGDAKQFLEFAEATARFAKWLAPYQSPKLSAIAIKEAPSELQEETTFTVNIFNERGAQVAKIVDGEVVEDADWKAYLKHGTKLYDSGKDVFGNDYGPQLVGQTPHVPDMTKTALADVTDDAFWSPFQ